MDENRDCPISGSLPRRNRKPFSSGQLASPLPVANGTKVLQ